MRYRVVENAPQGHNKKQAWIALNINELDLLSSIALKMTQTLPKGGPTARLQQAPPPPPPAMEEAIRELEKAGINDRSKEKYPYDDRAVI